MNLLRVFLILAFTLLSSACSLLPDKIDETKDWSAQRLYSEAKASLNEKSYERAIDLYEKLEARYPFGRYAQQALIESAYAYYKYDEPDTAIATLDRFMKTYPRHPHVDYALYMKGLINFKRGETFIDRFLPRDPSERDAGAARQSFFDFQELLRRFPDSKYAAESQQRMLFLRNNLAEYELHVADYYMRRGAYIAAANRGRYIVEKFQGTPAVKEGLLVMIDAYQTLGLTELAADAERVYELNYGQRNRATSGRPEREFSGD